MGKSKKHRKRRRSSSASDEWEEVATGPVSKKEEEKPAVKRQDWMLSMPARPVSEAPTTTQKEAEPELSIAQQRELNPEHRAKFSLPGWESSRPIDPSRGKSWRAMKVQRVYDLAEREGRQLEDVAVERFGSLEEWNMAVAEKEGRAKSGPAPKKVFGMDLINPTEKSAKETTEPPLLARKAYVDTVAPKAVEAPSQDELNKMKSKALRAKISRADNAQELEEEYQRNLKLFERTRAHTDIPPKRAEKKSRQDTDETDTSGKLDVQRFTADQRKTALGGSSQQELDNCKECQLTGYSVVAKSENAILALPITKSFVLGHCLIIPVEHVKNSVSLDDFQFEEIRNFQKCLGKISFWQSC